MNARKISTAVVLGAVMVVAASTSRAGMLTVTSTNNGLGQFEYVISGGPDLFFFGGGGTSLAIVIPSYGVLSATASPGWLVATNGTSVTLVHAGSLVLDHTIAVTATIASASAVAIIYDDLAINGAYARGWIIGDVYTTNLTLYASAASNETVSLNVAGYERFALVGPLVPEPAVLAIGVLIAVAACRRRSLAHPTTPVARLRILTMLVLCVTSRAAWAAVVSIPASADTFINSGLPNNNAGAVTHVAAGTDGGGGIRRGLFQFNVSGIPAGSTVMTAVVQMSVVTAPFLGAVNSVFDLQRVTEAWGEGTNGASGNSGAPATVGEATWSNRLYAIARWRSAGASGDCIAAASAATNVAGLGAYSWSGTSLVADVQFWVNNPNQNYGLILASQAEAALKTARAFGSREGAVPATLKVTYLPPVMDSNIVMTMAIIATNGNVTLAWPSQPNRSYDVDYCRTLTPAPNWLIAEPNVPSVATGTNTWTRPPFLASPAYTGNTSLLYRIQALPDVATPLPIALDVIASNLTSPTVLTHAGDQSGRLFVAEQTGRILVLAGGTNLLATAFLDLTAKMTNLAPAFTGAPRGINPSYDERGLLGLAFHPGYVTNRRFFVYYSSPAFGPNTNHESILAEYQCSLADPNVADTNATVLLRIAEPQFNHNGGALAFGTDGNLFVSVGDGGGANDGMGDTNLSHGATGNGQNTQTLLGKILRLDVNAGVPYAIPPDNPFASGGGLPEIFAVGFRNPWRMSFDRAGSNALFVADVGQDLWEEIDVVRNGGNYGWRIIEGSHAFDVPIAQVLGVNIAALAFPIHEYVHGPLGISVIGGFVYRGTQYSALVGAYVFGDFSTAFGVPNGALYYLAETRPGIWQRFAFVLQPSGGPLGRFVKGFGEGEDGELYLLSTTLIGPSGSSADIRHIRKPR